MRSAPNAARSAGRRGTWAMGAFYGQRVYDIYERMVAFAKTDPAHPPVVDSFQPVK